jgi:hypothetical protein
MQWTRVTMTKEYIVTWYSAGADETFLTSVDGDLELTIDQIMEIACAVEEVIPEWGYDIYSIIRAENVDVIC